MFCFVLCSNVPQAGLELMPSCLGLLPPAPALGIFCVLSLIQDELSFIPFSVTGQDSVPSAVLSLSIKLSQPFSGSHSHCHPWLSLTRLLLL